MTQIITDVKLCNGKQTNCQSILKLPMRNACRFLKNKNKPDAILQNFDPRLTCPISSVMCFFIIQKKKNID